MATTAQADSMAIISQYAHGTDRSTYVEMHAPTDPAAVATITYQNMQVNSMHDTGRYVIEWQCIEAVVFFVWNHNGSPDAIQVTVPPGYIAIPPDLSVQEGVVDVVQIYKWAGM